jgi:hypothetical protein
MEIAREERVRDAKWEIEGCVRNRLGTGNTGVFPRGVRTGGATYSHLECAALMGVGPVPVARRGALYSVCNWNAQEFQSGV